jgi:hypothetical protein
VKIEIHIETVVVQGVAIGPWDASALTTAIKAGLEQRLTGHGISPGLHLSQKIQTIERRHGSPAHGLGPNALGGHIADAIINVAGGSAGGGIDK